MQPACLTRLPRLAILRTQIRPATLYYSTSSKPPKMERDNGQPSQQPGLVGGHVQYIKGATEEVIGRMSGSRSWSQSGEQDKAAARAAMQKATEHRDPTKGYGRVEEMAGNLTGCEGMQKEGAASKKRD